MATTINFDLTGLKEKALKKIAIQNSLTPNQYAENVITDWLKAQVRGHYLDKFNNLTTQEMIQFFGDLE